MSKFTSNFILQRSRIHPLNGKILDKAVWIFDWKVRDLYGNDFYHLNLFGQSWSMWSGMGPSIEEQLIDRDDEIVKVLEAIRGVGQAGAYTGWEYGCEFVQQLMNALGEIDAF